jgi:amino acid adenylation domain-containing protein
VGTPTAGRRHADLQQIIGMFVNTLVLRNYPIGDKTYREFLKEIKKRSLQAFENQDYPYEELVEEVAITRDASRNPLFDTMFVMQNLEIPGIEIPGLRLIPYEHQMETSKFDLTLIGTEKKDRLLLIFEYSAHLFKKSTIERFTTYLKKIVSTVVDNPDVKICNVGILEEEEKREIIYDFNDTAADYPKDKVLHQLFEKQIAKVPDHTAVVSTGCRKGSHHPANGEQHISYGDLNRKTNQLAYLLMKKGIKPDFIVGIMVERSLEMIVGILAILKAGGVYLPIDPDYPLERKTFMLDDSGAHVLLTSSFLTEGSRFKFKGEIFPLDDMGLYNDSGKDVDRGITPEAVNKADKPAYIMYTSGSTGRPKGVLVEHRNVVRLVVNTNYVELTEETRILQTGAPVFDATTFEVWGALLKGGQLVLVEKETILDAHRLGQSLRRNKINTLWLTSPLFNQLAAEDHEIFSPLAYLLVGGDVLAPEFINLVRDKNKALKIINGYGPTENTTFSTTFLIDKNFDQAIPIGRPINNSTAFILDRNARLQPIGIFGELWVGGDGISQGYLNNPELTAEKFVRAVIGQSSLIVNSSKRLSKTTIDQCPMTNDRLYRTGDIVRWLPDGNIEFSGRIDHQVKIRGFRIELSEIENYLLKHHDIKETIVIADKDENEDKYLCAYTVSNHELSISQLRNYLSKNLPEYMIPSYFVPLEALPLTPNGKVDRKALPKPDKKELTGDYIAPQNLVEKKLVEIWSEVLGIKKYLISMDSNFFQLGGHSLKATILISKIHKKLNVKVPLAEIFKKPVLTELCQFIAAEEKGLYASIEKAEKKEYYRLSSAQKRLYLLHQIDPTSTAYNIPAVFILEGVFDKAKLEGTFQGLIHRHEGLRTSFGMIDDVPIQRIHEAVSFEIEYDELGKEGTRGLAPLPIIKNSIRTFDLSRMPLLRVALIKTAEDENKYILTVDMHHIISDGTSMGVLVKDFMRLYHGETLSPLRIHYKDFSEWQNSKKQKECTRQQERYWLKEFSGEIPVLNLPVDFPRPVIQDFAGRSLAFEIEKEETQKLKNLAMTEGATLYMVLLALFNVLLARLSGQEEVVVGSPVAGRRHPDMEPVLGMFVNTLALRNYPSGEKTIKELIGEVKEKTLEAQENQDFPFEDLVERVTIDRDASRNPLFDVMFILQNIDIEALKIPGMKLEPYPYESGISKFDITLYCEEAGEHLLCSIEYCTTLFKEETIRRMINYFKKITAAVIEDSDIRISSIEIIPEEEKKQLLFDFNDTKTAYPGDKTIPELFEQQAEEIPDHTAVSIKDQQLTYRQLKKNTNGLAHLLRDRGIKPDNIVGIIVKRSLEMVIGIMAILKAGGAYLPVEPEYPEERIRFMLENSESKILLTPGNYTRAVAFDGETMEVPPGIIEARSNLEHITKPEDLLYLIYTSGSTGRPKGAMVKIKSFMNLLNWYREEFNINARDNVLLMASLSFDLAQKNLFVPLITGARLCLPSCRLHHYDELSDLIVKEQITMTNCAPSVFYPLVEFNLDSGFIKLKSLREVFLGGESIQTDKLRPWINSESCSCEIVNTYGPTECTDIASFYRIKQEEINQRKNIPIGKPIDNVKLFVLDRNRWILPVGIAGELCIGGISLGKGYYNNEQLTREKFIEVVHFPVKKVYRTGDLTRWLPDGNIELLGRIDHQVKIRGFRIELGEIESQLRRRDEIKEAVVLAKEDKNGEKYLCAYIVLRKELAVPELRGFLSESLPDFMIPSYFVMLDEIPLTPNGKTDRRALPEPDPVAVEGYTAPRNRMEEKLTELWSEVLEVEKSLIGIDTNFFELGGHSLKVNSLLMKIHRTFDVKLPMAEVFKTPRIRELAKCIKGLTKNQYESIEPVEKKDYYQVSSTQKRLYILQQMESGHTTSYNMLYVIPLEKEIDREKLASVFIKLIDRHESLRTSFEFVSGEPVQRIHDSVNISIHDFGLEVESKKVEEIIAGFKRPFDLSRAPLLRVGLMKLPHTPPGPRCLPSQEEKGDKYLLLVDMHHIITDDASQNILEREFWALADGQELGPLRLHYKDFSEWQNSQVQKELIQQEETFWVEEFSHDDQLPVLNLPTDYPRPLVQSFEGSSVHFVLTPQETRALRDMAKEIDATLFICILSIYTILLAKLSGHEDIIVGTPVAARRHADMEHIIGMFANTLVMRNYPSGEKTFKEFLLEVKGRTLKAFENQEYPFEELVEKVPVQRDISRNPIFDVMFNLLNQSELNDAVDIPVIDGQDSHQYEHRRRSAKFDLNLTAVDDNGKSLYFDLEYCTRLFNASTIERMIGYFRKIVASLSVNTELKMSDIELITPEEKNRILEISNGAEEAFDINQTIHGLFENQMVKSPDSVALVGLLHSVKRKAYNLGLCSAISFRELNEKSNQLARVLIDRGITADTVVALMMERSIEMMVAILAILKAGGAYLPIDPQYPGQRIQYILADSNANLLVTTSNLFEARKIGRWEDRKNLEKVLFDSSTLPSSNLHPSPAPVTSLAYVIYTSGSTGRPRGVLVQHRSVVNIVSTLFTKYPLLKEDTYLLKTTYTFDVSVSELFGWYLGGGRLAILEAGGEKDPLTMLDWIERIGVTHINFVPSMFGAFLEVLDPRKVNQLSNLKYIFLAGEALAPHLITKFNQFNTRIIIENIYGPTENTIYASQYSLSTWQGSGSIPIGKPLSNIQLYILNPTHRLQPIGVLGELCIGGEGLARGYLNRPELTEEKFFDKALSPLLLALKRTERTKNPLSGCSQPGASREIPGARSRELWPNPHILRAKSQEPTAKLYKTGDLCRWLPDGNIEFFGRIDHQVKIRGFRIEPGEIENQLSRNGKVRNAVVVVKENEEGDRYLCAYIVPARSTSGEAFDVTGLRNDLLKFLPDYMIPSYFIPLEKIPLTPNGKLDRKSLPEPQKTGTGEEFKAPRDGIEKKLVKIWEKELNAIPIGIYDHFFDIGGHSLKVLKLINTIHKEFNVKINFQDFFQFPTVASLSTVIRKSNTIHHIEIVKQSKKEYYELSYPQERLWFIYKRDPGNPAFNMLKRVSFNEKVDKSILKKVFEKLLARHESFRTCFKEVLHRPVQMIRPGSRLNLEFIDLSQLTDKEREKNKDIILRKEKAMPFNLELAPLLRVKLIKYKTDEFDLLLTLHHIIFDGWSMEILEQEFQLLYEACKKGETGEMEIEPLRVQYKDYAAWHNRLLADEKKMQAAKEFWKKQLSSDNGEEWGKPSLLRLPYDFSRKNLVSKESAGFRTVVPGEIIDELRKFAKKWRASLFMVLLAGFYLFLSRLSGQKDIMIAVPGAARQHEDLKNIIGCFVNTLILRNRVNPHETFTDFLAGVQQNTSQVLEYQSYPLELICSELKIKYPEISVFFNMLTFGDKERKFLENFDSRHSQFVQEAKFDMVCYLAEYRNGVEIDTHYYKRLFKAENIEKFMKLYVNILAKIAHAPDKKVSSYSMPKKKLKIKRDSSQNILGKNTK